ncbi:FAD binding domain-containing protein [Apiospora kogelbergensis]|uniref:FAD binding domain-containing protein n=1 Tax=Apiospora kogelbergensis TaxID=1337665 RepID=UPI00312DEF08
MAAVRDFAEDYPDEKADTILTAEIAIGILVVYYSGPESATGIFSNFTDSVPLVKNLTKRSYAKLLTGNNWAVLRGDYIGTATTLLPSKKHSVEITGSAGCSM